MYLYHIFVPHRGKDEKHRNLFNHIMLHPAPSESEFGCKLCPSLQSDFACRSCLLPCLSPLFAHFAQVLLRDYMPWNANCFSYFVPNISFMPEINCWWRCFPNGNSGCSIFSQVYGNAFERTASRQLWNFGTRSTISSSEWYTSLLMDHVVKV